MKKVAFGLIAALVAGPALAQDQYDSPFAFADSGAKGKAAAAAAGAGGGKVIGGTMAADGAWPWQVGLLIAGKEVGPDAHFCGGSIVLDRWVLTAAHCVHMADRDGNFADLPPRALNVFVGGNTLAPGNGDVVPVEAIFVHPAYVGNVFDNDIALIKLARKPDAAYQTITVPTPDFGNVLDQEGVPTIVTGWGLVNGGEHPADMYQAEIQILERDDCNGAMMEARAQVAAEGFIQAANVFGLSDDDAQAAWEAMISRAPLPISDNMLCSGTYEGGRTSCQGDSGGPLVVPLTDGSYIQAGIVSWGLSANNGHMCAEDAFFSAYTKVSNYLGWLDQTINANP